MPAQKKKQSNSNKSANKNVNIGTIIIAAAIIISVVFACIMFRDEISTLILGFSDETPNENNNTPYVPNPSILGGSTDIIMPEELKEIGLEIHYIDVGQGDSIVVRLPDGKDMIIDAGSGTFAYNRVPKATVDSFMGYLELINIDYFDYMIATHPHSDHINLLDDVLLEYEVRNIYYNENIETEQTATFKEFEKKANEEGANLIVFDDDGDVYEIVGDDYLFTIYSPGYARFTADPNDMSPIIVLEYKERRFVFTGDAEIPVEEWFIDQFEVDFFDCDVLKIGHHGSSSSTSSEFLSFIDPEFAIICVGETNTYNHPNPFTMNLLYNMGIITYRTNRHGNIILYCDVEGTFAFGVQNEVPPENNKYRLPEMMIITITDEE